MDFLHSIAAARIVFILGIVNFVAGAWILMTCRWVPVARITKHFMNNGFYKALFRSHTYVWWVFWISVIVHMIFAIGFMGWPF